MTTSKVDIVIHGGLVVTSTSAYDAAIAISGERFVAVGPREVLPEAERYIDATGKYVLPGAIDCHVHFDNADDWTVGTRAAAHAGLTTLIPFVSYDVPTEESLPDAITRLKEEVSRQSVVDFSFNFILLHTPYVLGGLPAAIRMGVSAYKMFMTYKKRGSLMCPDDFIAAAMEAVASNGGLMQLHCENGDVIDYLEDQTMAEGRTHPRDYAATRPPWVEEEAINRGILLAKMAHCPMYVVHLSTQAGLERIKQAQSAGQKVWTETCPQYLLLDEGEMERLGPLAKVAPPLRAADRVNQDALWEGSARGYISNIGSDHSPAPMERKAPGWDNVFLGPDGRPIPFGSPSVETLVPLMYSEGVVKRGLPIWWMARVLAENPARIFGLYPRKGVIQPGSNADLLIIDPHGEHTVRAADLCSNAGYTPYEGWGIKGRPWMTLLRGRVLLNDGDLEQAPGYGQFLPAAGPTPPVAGSVV